MSQILKSPSKYVQGKGVLKNLDMYLQGMGNHLMILISEGGMKRSKHTLEECFDGKDYVIDFVPFSGECTREKIEFFAQQCKDKNVSAVVGFGGGKILDTAKGVGHYAGLPVIIAPTVCATDAPCSSLSVMYTDDGVFDAYLFLNKCPDIVIVDSEIIANAPAKLLVAGMGDAMATFFEARACRASGSNNQIGAKPTRTATELATLTWKYLKENGAKAKSSVEKKVVTEELENIIEVNTYLSGVGFESGGLAAAHGIQKGFTVIPELHDSYHGNKVAFCTLAQLVLEDAPDDEMNEVLKFCFEVGLPICFEDLGYMNVKMEDIRKAADKACAPGSTIYHLPFDVDADKLAKALISADSIGRKYKEQLNKL